jgi:flavodoxin
MAALSGCLALAGCASSNTAKEEPKTEAAPAARPEEAPAEAAPEDVSPTPSATALVCYFSQTGNTEGVAMRIAEALGADTYRIETVVPYTDEDLDYSDRATRATAEQDAPETRPELAGELPDITGYDLVFVGHPIWWGKAPRAVCGFVESVGLADKRVAQFCTSGSSSIDAAHDELASLAPESVTWLDARRFAADASSEEVTAWVDEIAS